MMNRLHIALIAIALIVTLTGVMLALEWFNVARFIALNAELVRQALWMKESLRSKKAKRDGTNPARQLAKLLTRLTEIW